MLLKTIPLTIVLPPQLTLKNPHSLIPGALRRSPHQELIRQVHPLGLGVVMAAALQEGGGGGFAGIRIDEQWQKNEG